jgi:glucokinase
MKGLTKGTRWIGVDLGGTRVRVVLSDEKGNFIGKRSEEVDTRSVKAVTDQIVRLTHFLCTRHGLDVKSVEGMGIVSAGPLIQEEGELFKPPNLPFERIPVTKPITEQLGIPSRLINDCAGAVLGENMFGAAKGIDNCVYVTISTGLGCGAIVNGTLLLGKDGNAHEVGHFVIDYQGRLTCGCGRRGHWEAYCSGRNIPNYVRMRLKEMRENAMRESLLFRRLEGDLSRLVAADLFACAKKGDKLSLKLVNEIGVLNAMGFANVTNAYDPSLITVGGAVTLRNKRMILSPIKKYVKDYAINRIPRIMATPLGEDVGLYGAVAAALKYIS